MQGVGGVGRGITPGSAAAWGRGTNCTIAVTHSIPQDTPGGSSTHTHVVRPIFFCFCFRGMEKGF